MSAQYPPPSSNQQTLTDASTIDWNVALGDAAKVTLGGNRTVANPTNAIAGRVYILETIQDATGSRVPSWGDAFVWPGGTVPTPTGTALAHDVYTFFFTGGKFLGSMVANFIP